MEKLKEVIEKELSCIEELSSKDRYLGGRAGIIAKAILSNFTVTDKNEVTVDWIIKKIKSQRNEYKKLAKGYEKGSATKASEECNEVVEVLDYLLKLIDREDGK